MESYKHPPGHSHLISMVLVDVLLSWAAATEEESRATLIRGLLSNKMTNAVTTNDN